MAKPKSIFSWLAFSLIILIVAGRVQAQGMGVKLPETALPLDLLKLILNEVSGQLAFNNEAVLASHMPPRPAEEYEEFFMKQTTWPRSSRTTAWTISGSNRSIRD